MATDRKTYILRLSHLSRADGPRAGAKAANLGELFRAGFPVPDGFVLTTEAFDLAAAQNGFSVDTPPQAVAAARLPDGITGALLAATAALGDVPLAVRSSGVAEDLPDASFAGQYETVLGVQGAESLVAAVRRCWASAFSDRLRTYHQGQGRLGIPRMAVLIQRLVQADAAGVAFTANPVTGNRGETMVNAVRGLGERLVSGEATPDECLVSNGEAICRQSPEGAIGVDEARTIAGLAKGVEAHFGTPQDIEWAIEGGDLFLLQARPITALPDEAIEPIPVPVEVPEGYWQREASHAPLPHSALMRSIYTELQAAGGRALCQELSLLIEAIEFREIGGWEYTRAVPLGGKERRPPPSWLMPLLIRTVPQLRSRIKECVEAMRSDKPGRFVQRWYEEWHPHLEARIGELRDVDLASLSDEHLEEHFSKLISLAAEAVNVHVFCHVSLTIALGDLVFTSRELLQWEEAKTFEMLNGLSEMSTEPSRKLAELARTAQEHPALLRLLEQADRDTTERLADVDREFASALADYQRQYGCRALRYEVADPSLAETPELVLRLLQAQIARGYDPSADNAALERKRNTVIAEARALLADRQADLQRFERALTRAQQAYPIREDNEFFTMSAPMALIRYASLELGSRLMKRGQIDKRDEVFFLELEEALTALRGGIDQRPLAKRRKGERAWVLAHPGPATYGTEPPPPSFTFLPSEARLAHEALLWHLNLTFAQGQSGRQQVPGETLTGIAASQGQYTGPVRVIMDESEFHKLQPGDVLVCPVTSPVWSVLFPGIGALVTDTGGILSHPAIIAREYRVPAVVATGNATQLLHDGQLVTVDGDTGVIDRAL